jgi:hypothetical protein
VGEYSTAVLSITEITLWTLLQGCASTPTRLHWKRKEKNIKEGEYSSKRRNRLRWANTPPLYWGSQKYPCGHCCKAEHSHPAGFIVKRKGEKALRRDNTPWKREIKEGEYTWERRNGLRREIRREIREKSFSGIYSLFIFILNEKWLKCSFLPPLLFSY